MRTHKDVESKINNNTNLISLEKLVGKKIKEIQGHLSKEYDDITFKLYRIIYEDNSSSFVEGEHDFPYLNSLPKESQEELNNIYKTSPDYDSSEDEDNE